MNSYLEKIFFTIYFYLMLITKELLNNYDIVFIFTQLKDLN